MFLYILLSPQFLLHSRKEEKVTSSSARLDLNGEKHIIIQSVLLALSSRYKSNEDYVYVRGRGRGKYICEECGIRCKKPSMLKKHIRTHTDVRPYVCKFCNFAFKTKGRTSHTVNSVLLPSPLHLQMFQKNLFGSSCCSKTVLRHETNHIFYKRTPH